MAKRGVCTANSSATLKSHSKARAKLVARLARETIQLGDGAVLECKEMIATAGYLISDNRKLMRLNRKIVRGLALANKSRKPVAKDGPETEQRCH